MLWDELGLGPAGGVIWAAILITAGALLLLFTRRRWFGDYRQWAVGQQGPFIVYVLPAIGVAAVAFGIGFLTPATLSSALFWAAMVGLLASFLAYAVEPRWWGPAWYHKVRHEMNAPSEASKNGDGVASDRAIRQSARELAAVLDGPPSTRWRAYLVEESEGLRKYGVRHITERPGTLEVRPTGLAFIPGRWAQPGPDGPYFLPIGAREVKRIWVVPPGADPDGRVPRGVVYRHFNRVVVETDRKTFSFVLPHARDRAHEISETLGSPVWT
jgi:hypothetical protein